ncbi:FecR family protein [Dinghuibacter silviterrae]|uniref:FecR family protein n=1 Tax=Dinghuibacter silviterrae TaxID=1539049 RepID=A0A4R8DTU7_9BACT|nr:FecR domain-containing protein [Dinghuibacter silviterrae]TDX00865.1 FecR family protein [Dinghuibacter silviterrae]
MPLARLWELLARKYNDGLSGPEQEELDQLLSEHRDALELNEILTRSEDLGVKKLTTAMDEARSREWIASRIEKKETEPVDFGMPVRPLYKRQGFVWAMVIGIFIGAGFWLYRISRPGTPPAEKPNQVATSLSKTRITLPDGTFVVLNKNSQISYNRDFGVRQREITLTGEAYFDVARNESVPLVVKAGPVHITVLGTAFNVRAYAADSTIETSLIRGSIEVSSSGDPGRTILMRPYEKIVFSKAPAANTRKAKEEPSFVMLDRIKPNTADSSINEIVWTQDRLVFQKEPFQSVAWKMERWYGVKINFSDTGSRNLLITGSLEKENLAEALNALQQLSPFDYTVDRGVVTISKRH